MILKDGLCLNRACHCNGEKVFSAVGIHHTPWNKGIPPSEETRKKMSKAHNGHPAWNKGVPRSEETKQKLSETLKGHPAWDKGTHRSEETRKRMSLSHKGLPAINRIKISIEDVAFESITEASKYYNVYPSTISSWVKTKKHNIFYIK